ncbi:hypothetical protein BKA58DRAFT_223429 [Alternaria rosae]|uniref:uncharacterized protein n=1 Tax=Alternaria rosae TaxID=1187941 RepID=UPI001E8D5AA2|nr:uncharacterized protein BKA58DRAFT_223429 [Alternaria rosae]KAH6865546.1 hypothetical protein BKA58DRAFT_223429 [Alternaria rosae]
MTLSTHGSNDGGSNASFSQTTVRVVGYTAISIVSVAIIARCLLQYLRPRRIVAQDCCMAFAYVLFLAQCILYIVLSPIRGKVQEATEGKIPRYPELPYHVYLIGRLIFPALMFFWAILWTVKFGLLLLYRKLTVALPRVYNRMWWFLVVFCAVSLVGNYVAFLTSCVSLHSFFDGSGGCNNKIRQFVSIWYSFGADTITSIMLIVFPLHLTWNLQMPRRQKIAIMVLFASGVFCILIATLRAANVTARTIRTGKTMDGTWLAVWSMAETAVAILIGLCPSFAILINANRRTTHNANGWGFNLRTIGSASTRPKPKATNALDTFWTNIHGSQEELAGKQDSASVTTTAD